MKVLNQLTLKIASFYIGRGIPGKLTWCLKLTHHTQLTIRQKMQMFSLLNYSGFVLCKNSGTLASIHLLLASIFQLSIQQHKDIQMYICKIEPFHFSPIQRTTCYFAIQFISISRLTQICHNETLRSFSCYIIWNTSL